MQVGLNLCYYHDELPSIARCGELGIPVTIFEPLASGILSGKTLEQVQASWPGQWRETDWYKEELGTNAEQNFAVADRLRQSQSDSARPLHRLRSLGSYTSRV